MDDTNPATKGDLQRLEQRREQSMNNRFEGLEQSMGKKFERRSEDVNRVLSILVKVKNKTDDHEERIEALEEAMA
jgi:flagellar biosynthesis regulator FlaF